MLPSKNRADRGRLNQTVPDDDVVACGCLASVEGCLILCIMVVDVRVMAEGVWEIRLRGLRACGM